MARAHRRGGLTRGYELGLAPMNGVLLPISLVFTRSRRADRAALRKRVDPAVPPLQLVGLTSALYGMRLRLDDADRARLAEDVRRSWSAVVVVFNLGGNWS